ncbi:MAG: hypothetical protein ACREXT_05525 [Gammaproteobacteria bacterium]
MNIRDATLLAMLCLGLGLAACQKKEGPVESATDSVKDALDIREHEKLKDAGEDAASAVENAVEGAKDAVE